MAFFPSNNAPGIFSQGSFINTGSETPETIARKRARIAAMMPRFGQANYIGEGIGQLLTGIGQGRQERALDEAETAGRQGAADMFAAIFNGRAQPGGFSILGQMPVDPASPQGIANDTMAALGKGPDFAALEQQYGLPQGYLSRTAQIESGGNPNAQNPNSSAGGMFQFIDSTAQQYGLENRFDPVASADAAARLARDNRAVLLQALGREPTAGELYLAHQQGAGGAAKLLTAGNAPAASVVGADAARLNGGSGMSAADFAGQWTGRFDGATPVSGGGYGVGAPSADINQLYALAMDPWQPQEVKALAMSMIQQQQEASDPMRQMQLQKAQLELEAMRNPKPDPVDLNTFTGPDGTVYSFNPITGQTVALTGSEAQPQPMTADERTRWNIPETDTRPYVMKDGIPTVIGGNGVTVNNNMGGGPEMGKLSTDYGYVLGPDGKPVIDPETGLPKAAPVPGSPAAVEAERLAKTSDTRAGNASIASDVVTTAALRARKAAGERALGGLGQNQVAWLNPYSDAAEVARQVEVLKSNAKVENLNAMRQSSPTGGALGSVTEKENDMLASKAGALDPSSPNFERDLTDYTRTLLRIVHGDAAGDEIFRQTWGDDSNVMQSNGYTIKRMD